VLPSSFASIMAAMMVARPVTVQQLRGLSFLVVQQVSGAAQPSDDTAIIHLLIG
jgi:hypothetical protein